MNRIALSGKHGKGKLALVSREDYEDVSQYRWYLNPANGMVFRYQYIKKVKTARGWRSRYKRPMLHRHIMKPSGDFVVDHANHDCLDNRRENLRVCTRTQNQQNSIKPISNTSGYKGVCKSSQGHTWRAEIKVNKATKYLGTFRTALAAAEAYDIAARKYHKEFALTNGT